MGYFVQVKRLFDKRLLFIFLAIFSFQFIFSWPNVGRTCEVDNHLNPIPETCICNYIGDDGLNHRFDCDCYDKMQKGELCKCQSSTTNVKGMSCKEYGCFQYLGSGCYRSGVEACLANGYQGGSTILHGIEHHLGGTGGHMGGSFCRNKIDGVYHTYDVITYASLYYCNGEDPYSCPSDSGSGSGSDGSGSGGATQKKVCSGGECKCYNLTTGYEETCLGSNGSGSGSGSGTGSGDNGSEDGKEDGKGHDIGDGDSPYDFGELNTDLDLPTHNSSSGNTHGGDGTSLDDDDKKREIDLGTFGVKGYLTTTAQCPAPVTVDLKLFGTLEVSYEYFCKIAKILRAIVVSFAWLSALLIIARINRS